MPVGPADRQQAVLEPPGRQQKARADPIEAERDPGAAEIARNEAREIRPPEQPIEQAVRHDREGDEPRGIRERAEARPAESRNKSGRRRGRTPQDRADKTLRQEAE
jgi:hypothetical protein